jgi:Tfp pilus assembly protein PilO
MSLFASGPAWLWRTVIGLLAVNLLAFFFLVRPAWDTDRGQESQILDLQRRIRAVQREGQSSETMLTALKEVEEFTQGYPQRSQLVPLIGELTAVAKRNGLGTPAVDYRPTEIKDAGLTRVTVSLGVEGGYAQIRRYLNELERLRRHLVVERVSFRDPRGGTAELQVQLQLALYLR